MPAPCSTTALLATVLVFAAQVVAADTRKPLPGGLSMELDLGAQSGAAPRQDETRLQAQRGDGFWKDGFWCRTLAQGIRCSKTSSDGNPTRFGYQERTLLPGQKR